MRTGTGLQAFQHTHMHSLCSALLYTKFHSDNFPKIVMLCKKTLERKHPRSLQSWVETVIYSSYTPMYTCFLLLPSYNNISQELYTWVAFGSSNTSTDENPDYSRIAEHKTASSLVGKWNQNGRRMVSYSVNSRQEKRPLSGPLQR